MSQCVVRSYLQISVEYVEVNLQTEVNLELLFETDILKPIGIKTSRGDQNDVKII